MATGLGQYVLPHDSDKYVHEGTVQHLTWDVIAWLTSVQPCCKLIRIRYEWEKLITGSHGKDMFLELTYERKNGSFPHAAFYFFPVVNWVIYFVDFIDLSCTTKVIIRMAKKEDVKI